MREPSLKEACGEFAIKAAQSMIVLPLMPVMFMVGIVSAGTLACLSVGSTVGSVVKKKIKGKK